MQIASALPLPVAQPVLLSAAPNIGTSSVPSVEIVSRRVWGAREPSFELKNLETPVGMVIISEFFFISIGFELVIIYFML